MTCIGFNASGRCYHPSSEWKYDPAKSTSSRVVSRSIPCEVSEGAHVVLVRGRDERYLDCGRIWGIAKDLSDYPA